MLEWFESDGVTPLGNLSLGTVGPGETYTGKHLGAAKQIILKNTGATEVQNVTVTITSISTYPANDYALIAVGDTQPAPEAFVDNTDPPLAVGDLDPNDTASIWVDASVPVEAPRQMGQMLNLRASGLEQ